MTVARLARGGGGAVTDERPAAGPHTDQAARDVLDDFGLVERTSERKSSDE